MRQWLPKRSAYLNRIFLTEGNEVRICTHCQKSARWRCLCCLGRPMYCRECCRTTHRQLIYHRLQKWTGQFFQDAGLWEVGVRLCVGHMGEDCPSQGELLRACQTYEANKDREDALATEANFVWAAQPPEPQCPPDANLPNSESINVDDDPDDPEWQDIPVFQNEPVPLMTPTPTVDALDNWHILIVDASGLISLPAIWCACAKQAGEPDEHLLDLQMLAASYNKIKTVFTFHCLDDYRLSNLECKTSAYHYYQKLRRLTNPAFPQSVPNR